MRISDSEGLPKPAWAATKPHPTGLPDSKNGGEGAQNSRGLQVLHPETPSPPAGEDGPALALPPARPATRNPKPPAQAGRSGNARRARIRALGTEAGGAARDTAQIARRGPGSRAPEVLQVYGRVMGHYGHQGRATRASLHRRQSTAVLVEC